MRNLQPGTIGAATPPTPRLNVHADEAAAERGGTQRADMSLPAHMQRGAHPAGSAR